MRGIYRGLCAHLVSHECNLACDLSFLNRLHYVALVCFVNIIGDIIRLHLQQQHRYRQHHHYDFLRWGGVGEDIRLGWGGVGWGGVLITSLSLVRFPLRGGNLTNFDAFDRYPFLTRRFLTR